MPEIEKHEDEGAKPFDAHLTRRLLGYLRPYRWRAAASVMLVILSSLFEIAGPAITPSRSISSSSRCMARDRSA
jgi:ABC-type multidrug transport system fused ATPase/permease subunit